MCSVSTGCTGILPISANNATYIVTVHNHVSGNPSPTKFDSTIAAKLTQAAESVRMTLLDHIILADEQYYSFKDNKKL